MIFAVWSFVRAGGIFCAKKFFQFFLKIGCPLVLSQFKQVKGLFPYPESGSLFI
ncbi:hypothetical protein EVA_04589 [gut metagenome]|uniref:Uncharacterized protein n=1 Tax=gut metagenome TaxID=749906 RepID=J9D3R8_9ZZZZ